MIDNTSSMDRAVGPASLTPVSGAASAVASAAASGVAWVPLSRGAVAWVNGRTYVSPTCELDVYDRVGGGDGFASGFFYGLMSGEGPEQAVRLGWAHGALLTTFPGDTTMASGIHAVAGIGPMSLSSGIPQ